MADTIRLDPHLWRVQLDLPPERGLTFALQVLAHAFMTLTADQPRAEPVCHNVRRSVVVLEGFGRPRQPCQGKKTACPNGPAASGVNSSRATAPALLREPTRPSNFHSGRGSPRIAVWVVTRSRSSNVRAGSERPRVTRNAGRTLSCLSSRSWTLPLCVQVRGCWTWRAGRGTCRWQLRCAAPSRSASTWPSRWSSARAGVAPDAGSSPAMLSGCHSGMLRSMR